MPSSTLEFANEHLTIKFTSENQRLRLDELTANEFNWLSPHSVSGLCAVWVDEQRWDAANLDFDQARPGADETGLKRLVLVFNGAGFKIEQALTLHDDGAVLELTPTIRNTGQAPLRIDRVDSVALALVDQTASLLGYSGDWGSEFEPLLYPLSDAFVLESRSGRSSKGNHPWFAITQTSGPVLSGAVAWSGNWVFRFQPVDTATGFSGGLHDWEFEKVLAPGESMTGAPVVLVLGDSLNAVSQQYARAGWQHWYPHNELADRLPVEWNHWWPYEDVDINAAVFLRNVETAAQMGFEVCTLDAGWFGPADPTTHWYDYRGDWELVNNRRFPDGIRPLAEAVHARGMKFGIWCEIEGLGARARLAQDHPDFVALHDDQRVGCVCFGNPRVQAWAYQTLARLISEYQADWIKLDFNLDPGAGCNRSDHGHQSGDGLYEHVQGYYRTLERIRRDFPEVVLENCSSGGLRIDLGMMRQTHLTFLSDPDWPVHDLQIFWGASTMLAPDRLLHWTYSHWRNTDPPPYQTFSPFDPTLTLKKWDYYARISMLGLYGLSQKLPDLPEWLSRRAAQHAAIYKGEVRRFVKQGDLYRLTEQPRRSGAGVRWPAFQYSLPDGSEHLLFIFRLPGAEPDQYVRMQNLQPERMYTIKGLEGEYFHTMTGQALMTSGLHLLTLNEEESRLLIIR